MRNISTTKSKEIPGVVLTKKVITNNELDTPHVNGSRPLSMSSDQGYSLAERHDLQRAASSASSQVK